MELQVTDMHTAGEPVRIVTGGYPELTGRTILEKRREARERYDHVRRILMREPRGHADMYGVIPVEPADREAALGVLFMHHEGYSTMCGHATIALGRWAIESGRVPAVAPVTEFALEVPCGIVRVVCELEGGRVVRTSFDSVPAFLGERDLAVEVAGIGSVHVDIAYGGAFYAVLPSSALGLDFFQTPVPELCARATSITETIRASVPITHPSEPDLGFLYGTILTDDAPAPEPSYNLCVFAAGQIDRSPTGSGVTARMARDHARGHIGAGTERRFHGPTGIPFSAAITQAGAAGVTVRVSGTSSVTGRSTYLIEADDPLADGFALPHRYAELLNTPRA